MALASKTTQEFIPIKDIRDGVVILKNGSLRTLLMVSSLNFALKSDDEQTAILLQFQNFLNSLDFSAQIFIQSRNLDITPYLQTLTDLIPKQEIDLLRIQIREYVEFVRNFTRTVNIMSKNFFVVIPYTPSITATKEGVLARIVPGKKTEDQAVSSERFEESKLQLEQRALIVEQNLASIGVRSARVGTEALLELFYKVFNPGQKDAPQTSILKGQA